MRKALSGFELARLVGLGAIGRGVRWNEGLDRIQGHWFSQRV